MAMCYAAKFLKSALPVGAEKIVAVQEKQSASFSCVIQKILHTS